MNVSREDIDTVNDAYVALHRRGEDATDLMKRLAALSRRIDASLPSKCSCGAWIPMTDADGDGWECVNCHAITRPTPAANAISAEIRRKRANA